MNGTNAIKKHRNRIFDELFENLSSAQIKQTEVGEDCKAG